MKLSCACLCGGLLVMVAISTATAGSRASASYSIPADIADAGGHRSTSSTYANDGSAAIVTGISTVASPAETVSHGYIGQLVDGLTLVSVVSVKTHNTAGTFGIDLPLLGIRGIECRSGGVNGNHTLVFTFGSALANVSGASVTAGSGSVASGSIGADPHQYVVNLTGVANAQNVSVNLTNVQDTFGNTSASVTTTMGVLLGDTNDDGIVNGGDSIQTRNRAGQTTNATIFRSDVNLDGFVNSGDTVIVRARSGAALP